MAIKQLLHGLTHNGEGHAHVLMTSILSKKKYKPLPARATNTRRFARLGYVFFFLSFFFSTKDHVRSPRLSVASGFHSHIRCAPDRTPHRAILRRDPARDRTIFIYRSNSFGWKDGRLPATGEDTFVDVYLLRRGFRAKAAPNTAEGKLKKTLPPGNNGLRSRA